MNDSLLRESLDLPPAFPGESFFSWCSRYHRLSCNPTDRDTSRQLFNHPADGFVHDLPSRLAFFAEHTSNALGSVQEIALERTVLGWIQPFISTTQLENIVAAMQQPGNSCAKYQLGLLASKIGVIAPLRACKQCMTEDLARHATSWWRVEHQWTSTYICREHGDLLKIATRQFHSRRLKYWVLPHEMPADAWAPMPTLTPTAKSLLTKLGENAFFLKEARLSLESKLLRSVYLEQASQRGWLAFDGSLRFQQLALAFYDTYHVLRDLPGLAFIEETKTINGGFLGLLLRQYQGQRHPLKHLLMMSFLFESPQEFLATYTKIVRENSIPGNPPSVPSLTEAQAKLTHLVSQEKSSVNAAATALGVSVPTALRHLRRHGIAYQKRPRVLNADLETNLVALLRDGTPAQDITTSLGIKRSFLKSYLALHPTLRGEWKDHLLQQEKEDRRAAFQQMLDDNPGLPQKRFRRLPNNGFQWLLRHDLDWLTDHLPALWRKKH